MCMIRIYIVSKHLHLSRESTIQTQIYINMKLAKPCPLKDMITSP